jgi:hypothetical protein
MTTPETDETVIDYTPADKARGRGLIWLAFLLTWGALAFGYVTYEESQNQQAPDASAQLKDIEQKIAQLATTQARVARHAQAIEGLSESLEAVDLLQQAVGEIPKQMNNEDKNKADKKTVIDLSELVKSVTTRVTDAEDSLYKIKTKLNEKQAFNTTTYTLLKLRDRVSRGEDYHIELDLLKRLTTNDAGMQNNLANLSKLLKDSAISLPTLREDFTAMIDTIKLAMKKAKQAATSEQDKTLWDNVTASLAGQIKVKKLDSEANNPTLKTIAKVQKSLRHGDVNSAIKDSGEFTGAAAKAITNWREQLKDLNKTQQLFERIYDHARRMPTLSDKAYTPAAGQNTSADKQLESSLIDVLDNSLSAQ